MCLKKGKKIRFEGRELIPARPVLAQGRLQHTGRRLILWHILHQKSLAGEDTPDVQHLVEKREPSI